MRDKNYTFDGLVSEPCPFCSVPYPNIKADFSDKVRTWFVYVECRYCKARGGFATVGEEPTRDEKAKAMTKAIENWKMRDLCGLCIVKKKVKKRLRRKV